MGPLHVSVLVMVGLFADVSVVIGCYDQNAGMNPLLWSAEKGHEEIARILLANSPLVDKQDV